MNFFISKNWLFPLTPTRCILIALISSSLLLGCSEKKEVDLSPILSTYLDDQSKTIEEFPIIIWISIDALRAKNLGCYGYYRNTSPQIDAFAKDAVLYTFAISQSPYTSVSYASMFTGLNPNKHMAFRKLDENYATIAEILSRFGYETVAFTGGGYFSEEYGLNQGFKEYHKFPSDHTLKDIEWEITEAKKYLSNFKEKGGDEKLFLFIHTDQVHDPYTVPKEYKTTFLTEDTLLSITNPALLDGNIRQYLGKNEERHYFNRYKTIPEKDKELFITFYDEGIFVTDVWIGGFLDFLKENGLYENSLIILNADHGQEFYEHGGWTHGTSVYGELIQVPLIIKYPKSEKTGVEEDRIARNVDIFPTILHDILKLDISLLTFDGVSLSMKTSDVPMLSFVIKDNECKKIAVIKGDYKYIRNYSKYSEDEPDRMEEELFLFKKDILDAHPLPLSSSDELELFRSIADSERKIYKRNRIGFFKKRLDSEAEMKIKKETENRLRDLGYIE